VEQPEKWHYNPKTKFSMKLMDRKPALSCHAQITTGNN